MRIQTEASALKNVKWYQYAIRFFFGGLVTAATGVVAKVYGPVIAGFFLAFPAIFPASVTLIESQEREKKEKAGQSGTRRARALASAGAAGSAMGTIGLGAFAVLLWQLLPRHSSALVLAAAALAWFATAMLVWFIRKTFL